MSSHDSFAFVSAIDCRCLSWGSLKPCDHKKTEQNRALPTMSSLSVGAGAARLSLAVLLGTSSSRGGAGCCCGGGGGPNCSSTQPSSLSIHSQIDVNLVHVPGLVSDVEFLGLNSSNVVSNVRTKSWYSGSSNVPGTRNVAMVTTPSSSLVAALVLCL